MTSLLTLALLPQAALAANPHDETSAELEAIQSRLSDMETQLDGIETELDSHVAEMSATLTAIEALLTSVSEDLGDHDAVVVSGLDDLDSAVASVATDAGAAATTADTLSTELADLTSAVDTLEDITSEAAAELDLEVAALGAIVESTESTVSKVYLQVDDIADTVIGGVETTQLVTSPTITIGGDSSLQMDVSFTCDAPYTVLNAYFEAGYEGVSIVDIHLEGFLLSDYIVDDSPVGTDVFLLADTPISHAAGDAGDAISFTMYNYDMPDSETSTSGVDGADYEMYWLVRTAPEAECSFTVSEA